MAAEAAHGFTGAVRVTRRGEVLLDAAYGAERGVPMQTSSRFWIASLGKTFVSAAVLAAHDRGLLSLDDPLSKFFPDAPPTMRDIRVAHLLAHDSGIGATDAGENAATREEAVRAIFAEPLMDSPGHAFHYSSANYRLAAAIVEVVTRQPIKAFISSEIFECAGLQHTGFAGDAGAAEVVPARGETPERLRQAPWGGQGVYSTTRDLEAWYAALRDGRVLKAASVEATFTPRVALQEGQGALGWFIGNTPSGAARIFMRGNEDFGANALLYAYPDTQTVIVVITHAGDADADTSWSRHVLGALEPLLAP